MLTADASIIVQAIFPESHSSRVRALIRGATENGELIIAPSILAAEMTNVIRKRMRADRFDLQRAFALVDDFDALPVRLIDPPGLRHEAIRFAAAHSLSTYDAHYVALASIYSCDLWVEDQRLLRAVQGKLPFVRWIGDYPLPPAT